MKRCLDCGAELGDLVHCGQCGQRASVARLTWRDLYRDVRDQFVEGNLPWWATLKGLTLDPGTVAKRYIEGQRTRYVHPLKFAFYALLVFTVVTIGDSGPGSLEWPELSYWRRMLATNLPLYTLLITPVAVLSLRLCFLRLKINMIETWVLVLYVLGWLALLLAAGSVLVSVMMTFVPRTDGVNLAVGLTGLFAPLVYFMYAVVRFYETKLHFALAGAFATLVFSGWAGLMLYIYWLVRPAWGG